MPPLAAPRVPMQSGPGRAAVSLGHESSPARRPLFVVYDGHRIEISKDRFVIGRGSRSTDLTIKDSAISRQHAMVEWVGHGPDAGRYFLVDLGSTNGVVFQGERFDRRELQEGDRFEISGHWISFTYK